MLLLLAFLDLQPARTVELGADYHTLSIYREVACLTPYTGTAVMLIEGSDTPVNVLLGGPAPQRILRCIPAIFYLYVGTEATIDRFHAATGIRSTVYAGDRIRAFAVSPEESMAVLEHGGDRLSLVSGAGTRWFSRDGLGALDVAADQDRVYVLALWRLLVFDPHGNEIAQVDLPRSFERLAAGEGAAYCFTPGDTMLYRWTGTWDSVALDITVKDVAVRQGGLTILDGSRLHDHTVPDR